MDPNKLLLLAYFALCLLSGILAAEKTKKKLTPILIGLTGGFCMVLASLNFVYRQWLAAILILVSYFWLKNVGETIVKLKNGQFKEIPVISLISMIAFIGILIIIL